MGYVLSTFRKLEMKGDIAVQKLLAKYGEKLPPFSTAGVRVDDDLNFSRNWVQRRGSTRIGAEDFFLSCFPTRFPRILQGFSI
jgi:hypothetical protein